MDLGDKVKHLVTGIEGVINGKERGLSDTVYHVLMDVFNESFWAPEVEMETLKARLHPWALPFDDSIKPGDRVKEKHSDITGVVISDSLWSGGRSTCAIDKGYGKPSPQFKQLLEVIDEDNA